VKEREEQPLQGPKVRECKDKEFLEVLYDQGKDLGKTMTRREASKENSEIGDTRG